MNYIQTQEQFNNAMANVLAAKYLRIMNGKVRLTQTEIAEMCQFGFKIELEDAAKPEASAFILTLITLEEAQKLMTASLKKNAS